MSNDETSILDKISIDEKNNLLWDGQKVQTEQKIVFGGIASFLGIIVAFTTIISSLLLVLAEWNNINDNYQKFICKKLNNALLLCD